MLHISSCICVNVLLFRRAIFPPPLAPVAGWKKFVSGVAGGEVCERASERVCGLSRLILVLRMKRCHPSAFVFPLPRQNSHRGCQSHTPVATLHQTTRREGGRQGVSECVCVSVGVCVCAIWPAVKSDAATPLFLSSIL